MITTEANSRTTPQRRSLGRPARCTRRTAPAIEGLEDRRLLTISITEFPIPTANADPSVIAAGPDGNIWFTEPDQNQLARINPTTHVITELPVPAGTDQMDSLVAAPDGFLYAIGIDSSRSDYPPSPTLFQINPATGATTEYAIPDATDNQGNIAVGPDGNLWFTESNDIGKFNLTTHATTAYTITGGLANPYAIAKGPDGALWFTDRNVSEIGRIDATTGAIVEYPTPTSGTYPEHIAAGPDGNMWFTESVYGIGQVGLINPTTRVITEIPIMIPDVSDSAPEGIAAGPDGSMWFTESGSDQVTEIDVNSYATTNYRPPGYSSDPVPITLGPDGNLWFIDLGSNSVGEVSDSAVVQPPTGTTTALASSLNPASVGATVTFTATVARPAGGAAPTGTVTFTIDGSAEPAVPLRMVGGADEAVFAVSTLAVGKHTISARYNGDTTFAASTLASPLVQTVQAVPVPAGNVPKVELVQRFGVHMHPTVLVVSFNEALDPASAVNLDNYKITDPAGGSVRIRSAVFDAANDTVTLRPAERVNLHHTYHLTLVGTGPDGIQNTRGVLLDGANTGSADGDYTGTLTWRNLVLTPAEAKKYDHASRAKPDGPLNHRFLHPSH